MKAAQDKIPIAAMPPLPRLIIKAWEYYLAQQ